jgi:hypothetical protein
MCKAWRRETLLPHKGTRGNIDENAGICYPIPANSCGSQPEAFNSDATDLACACRTRQNPCGGFCLADGTGKLAARPQMYAGRMAGRKSFFRAGVWVRAGWGFHGDTWIGVGRSRAGALPLHPRQGAALHPRGAAPQINDLSRRRSAKPTCKPMGLQPSGTCPLRIPFCCRAFGWGGSFIRSRASRPWAGLR